MLPPSRPPRLLEGRRPVLAAHIAKEETFHSPTLSILDIATRADTCGIVSGPGAGVGVDVSARWPQVVPPVAHHRPEHLLRIVSERMILPREPAIQRLGILVAQFTMVPKDLAVKIMVKV